jgi:hypothetical protein
MLFSEDRKFGRYETVIESGNRKWNENFIRVCVVLNEEQQFEAA